MAVLLASFSACEAAVLKKVTFKETKGKFRLVLLLDQAAKYSITKTNDSATISLSDTTVLAGVPRSLSAFMLDSLKIEDNNGACQIKASFKYLTSSKVFALKNPDRIVADFSKVSKMLVPKMPPAKIESRITIPEIEKVYVKSLPDKFKIVVNLTSLVPYKITNTDDGIVIELPETNSILKSRKIITNDKLIPRVSIDQVEKSTVISIFRNYPSFYQIYKLDNPDRLVVEFDKASRSTIGAKMIVPGLRYVKFVKGTEDGPVTVNSLFADQNSLNVYPYMACTKKDSPNIFGAIGSLFTFWMPKKEEEKGHRETVSGMADDDSAIAGVNGTFFGDNGEPLGVLMMNGELISYSINDRTALIMDWDNKCYIDNVSLAGDAQIEGVDVPLSGVNRKRQEGEAIIYTPRYGGQVEETSAGMILTVVNNEVKDVARAKAPIPNDGYILSLDPAYYGSLGDRLKVGSKVNLTLKLIPLSAISSIETKHVIGGGPRLLKMGQIYISGNSEKFKNDVANSRAARTAVGISKEGILVFATVDKGKQSAGATLPELAQIMKDLGCVDAMNLDGGGSSTMVISGEVINSPVRGGEVPVSNSILIGIN